MDRVQTLQSYLSTVYVPSKLDLKPTSVQQLRISLSLLDQWAGRGVAVSELSPELVMGFLRNLTDAGRSARTVNGKRGAIITVWRHAARKGLAPKFDPADIPRRKEPTKHPTSWTTDELRQIIWHVERPWLRTLVLFLYETGTRLSASVSLTWSDWNPDLRTMRLPAETAKTGLEQFVRVTEQTAQRIEMLRPISRDERIFPCAKSRRSIWRELKAACRAAGLPHTRRDLFQKIRRTCATLTAAHAGIDAAARQLGHTSTAMTLAHYIDPRMLPQVHASDVLPPL